MPFGIPENFEASSRWLPYKLIGSCVMSFVVDMSMCFFSLAHGTTDCGIGKAQLNFKTSPMESIIFGWLWYVFTLWLCQNSYWNGHRHSYYSWFSHWKWWFSIAMLVYQRVNGCQWSFHVLSTSVMVFPRGVEPWLSGGRRVAQEVPQVLGPGTIGRPAACRETEGFMVFHDGVSL